MGRKEREKGKRGERLACKFLGEYGFTARRGIQFSGGHNSPDVISDFPLHIEVKFTKKLLLKPFCEQAATDAGDNRWVVMWKQNRKPWLFIFHRSLINEPWLWPTHMRQVSGNLKVWKELEKTRDESPEFSAQLLKDDYVIMYGDEFMKLWKEYECQNG